MKDTKSKVMYVARNIRAIFYEDGEFEIRFRYEGYRAWIFAFTKLRRIKCSTIRNKSSKDTFKNYKNFRYMVNHYEKKEDIPAWLKSLALWKFDKPTKT